MYKEEWGEIGNWCVHGEDKVIREFNHFIDSMELVEPLLVSRSFTWIRLNGSNKSHIDRALVSMEWYSMWSGSTVYVLKRNISNHCSLHLKNISVD